jgi:hypothetical protein
MRANSGSSSQLVDYAAFVKIAHEKLRHQIEQILIRFLKSNAVINKQSVDKADDQMGEGSVSKYQHDAGFHDAGRALVSAPTNVIK